MAAVLLIAVAAMVAPVGAHAREWRVRLDGSGDFTTIGAGIEAAAEGDTISIGPGDYSTETLVRAEKSLCLVASDSLQSTIAPTIAVGRVGDVEVAGLTIRGSRNAGMYSQAVRTRLRNCSFLECEESALVLWADSVWVENCTFERNRGGNQGSDPGAGAIDFVGRSPDALLTVEGCTFLENRTLGDSGAIGLETGSLEVRNNYFDGNEADRGAAIYILISQTRERFVIENNTFVRNVARDTVIYIDGGAPSYITNNIFAFNDCLGYWVEGFGMCGCNLFWQNRSWGLNHLEWGGFCYWLDEVGLGDGEQILDPEFCDPEGDDYSLRPSSPGLPENFNERYRELGCEGRMGAFDVGCGFPPTLRTSWGELKQLLGGAEEKEGRGEEEER